MIEDFPMPGWPCTHTPVLETSPVRSQCGGVEPDGLGGVQVPTDRHPGQVAPEDTANGNSPHSWLVVPA